MGRRFSFFKWARGVASEPGRDFRRLLILLGCVIGLVVVVVITRVFFWKDSVDGDHPHEKGPHGGIVLAIEKEDAHYHAEVVLEKDGRVRLFLFGKDTEHVVEVPDQLLIGRVERQGEVESASLILRPARNLIGDAKAATSQFVGRLSPHSLEYDLSVSIDKIEIHGRSLDFQFVLHKRAGNKEEASDAEKSIVLKPGGKYTVADVETAANNVPSESFKNIPVAHDLRPNIGELLCPVTRAKADARIRWRVNGHTYWFCCPPCILEFVEWAKSSPDKIAAPEELKAGFK